MRTLLLAGVAVAGFGIAGLATSGSAPIGSAWAQDERSHVMMVRFPNGTVERIEYVGDVPPRVVLAPQAVAVPMENPFAMLQRMSAALFQTMGPIGGLTEAARGQVPAGAHSFSFVSTLSGSGVCSRSMSITYPGNGAQPLVVSHTSGDCGPAATAPAAATVQKPSVPTIEAKAEGPAGVYAALVRPVSDRRD
jgi:hypothetical protein